ncbi:MAG: DUF167 domain-containing protein [Sphingomonas sp.]|nr:DUF167 domain-containing protein [Sphingomonas sp.]
MTESPVTPDGDGVRLAIRVTPRAKRSCIAGSIADADGRAMLAVRLAAQPVDGAANKALIALLAELTGLPRSAISILSGESGRRKIVRLAGIDAESVSRRLESGPD